MNFITLTDNNGGRVIVNAEQVVEVRQTPGKPDLTQLVTTARYEDGARSVFVKESLDQVVHLLQIGFERTPMRQRA